MTEVVIEHSRDDTKTIVKATMEKMSSVDAYADETQRIVGKQNASLTGGNGATLIVNIPEVQEDEERTKIEVTAEKAVAIDMATDPEDIQSEFLDKINTFRDQNMEQILDFMRNEMSPDDSKEVSNASEFQDSQTTMGKKFIITFIILMVISILFGVLMMP